MWHFLYPVQRPNVVQRVDTWRKTAMKTEDLVVDEGGKRQIIEKICEALPDVGIAILSKTFIIEAVNLCNLTRLVVAAEDCDTLWIPNFQSHKECYSLDRVVPSINIIAYNNVNNHLSTWGGS